LSAVEEEIDGGGNPDLWQEYGEPEALVKRTTNINLVGKPDILEDNSSEKLGM